MNGEIEVSETPNWLNELEEKREKRLKAKLGHEAGAGAPCLKCGDKCPGLDLHFWRKCCKICKCSKEEHEVPDDDIYGWAQFQLLGSRPNKIKKKILLPGKKDEIDLEWAPKGHNDTIDKYLKTLPPDQLPIKGSEAAQSRRRLLHKQIPIHDVDPALCHDLTDDELSKMNEYIAHVRQSSAGVGRIVSLSSIIRGKLHALNPAEAALMAGRYAEGAPVSEIVRLQGSNRTGSLNGTLEKLTLRNKNLQRMVPNVSNNIEDVANPITGVRVHVKDYPVYGSNDDRCMQNVRYSSKLRSKNHPIDRMSDGNSNFDSENVPGSNAASSLSKTPLEYNSESSAFVPYHKQPIATNLTKPSYSEALPADGNEQIYENVEELKRAGRLPNYAAGKFDTFADVQNPTNIPRNVKDFAFGTYEAPPDDRELAQHDETASSSNGFRPIETLSTAASGRLEPVSPSVVRGERSGDNGSPNYQKFGRDSAVNRGENAPRDRSNEALRSNKKLSEFRPIDRRANEEDSLEPTFVNIGSIRDIDYPEIETAAGESGDFYEEYSPDSIREIMNNITLPDCHRCKKPFEENEFAVAIDRAEALFHAGCFKCAGCDQILADNVYFYHRESDNVYCLRDYAKIRGFPRCKACDELIFTKEYCLAENCTFHLKHFCCTECDVPLAGRDYLLEEEMPYCLPCYEQNKASKCNGCGRVIKPDEVGCTLNGVHFHATEDCVACKVCGAPLIGKKILLRNDRLYCSHECFGADG
ncbi:unnamed protein product [Phyllotreta striolata]|uniref:Uncharacterized protein n=1 Tax=Phyllotreta striolata TaxID=444603 RepID=A0A9N9TR69_PHYSR|nr:unnamed protein product [Phyllotreta striolata]